MELATLAYFEQGALHRPNTFGNKPIGNHRHKIYFENCKFSHTVVKARHLPYIKQPISDLPDPASHILPKSSCLWLKKPDLGSDIEPGLVRFNRN